MANLKSRQPHGWWWQQQHGSSSRSATSLCSAFTSSSAGWKLSVFLCVFLLSRLAPNGAVSASACHLDGMLPLPADPLAVAAAAPVAAGTGGASAQQSKRQQHARQVLQNGASQRVRRDAPCMSPCMRWGTRGVAPSGLHFRKACAGVLRKLGFLKRRDDRSVATYTENIALLHFCHNQHIGHQHQATLKERLQNFCA